MKDKSRLMPQLSQPVNRSSLEDLQPEDPSGIHPSMAIQVKSGFVLGMPKGRPFAGDRAQ